MKEKTIAPCDDFDVDANYAKIGAKCNGTTACLWYQENATLEEFNLDPQLPCKRRNIVEADTATVDMFTNEERES